MSNLAFSIPTPTAPCLDFCAEITESLADRGWALVDGFLSDEWAAELLEEQQQQFCGGHFRPAGIGREAACQLNGSIRRDRLLWLDEGNALPAQADYLRRLEELRLAVNRDLFMGLHGVETQAAMYPPGSFYRRHLDAFQRDNLRALTAIVYLNPRWHADESGVLRLYVQEQGQGVVDILPQAGRLVVFLSERFEHEVLTTRRARWSLTSWFSRRPLP